MGKENHTLRITRRNFIKYSSAGAALLAGNAFLPGRGLSKDIILPKKNSITVTTHEWFGDLEERPDFPEDWQIHMIEMAGANAPVLTAEEMRHKICGPTQTKLLSDISSGKKTAVITFDDLTRPTPVNAVAALVIKELKKGGIKDDHILFIGSYGNHRVMSPIEVKAKLGDENSEA